MNRRTIIFLMLCLVSIGQIDAHWVIEGTNTVYPYKPYQYFVGNATGMSSESRAGYVYTWKVTNGKIMDRYGNYTLSTLQGDYDENTIINVLWDFAGSGELSYSSNSTLLVSMSVQIQSGYLTVSNTSYRGDVSFDRAYITMQNVSFSGGGNVDINGYKQVTLKPGFSSNGSTMRIYNQMLPPAPYWENNLYSRSMTDNYSIPAGKSEMEISQNRPNPFTSNTRIEYYIGESSQSACIQINDVWGRVIKTIPITEKKDGWITLSKADFISGIYTYSLIVDNRLVQTKRMIVGN